MKAIIADFLKLFSLVAFVLFVVILGVALFKHFDPASKDIANIIIGGVITQITSIVSYWFGSSKGSADKTAMLSAGKAGNENGAD